MECKSIVNAGMKRMLILIVAAMPFVGASAQSQRETVYLHNGSVIKGEVIEAVPGESIKVKTADGSIFVYDMADVERITKDADDTAPTGNARGGHRGLDFTVDVGYGISTQGGSGIITTGIGLGKRFTKNFYFGLGTGAYVSPDGGNPLVPLTADFKALFPVGRARIAPGGLLRMGYVFNTEGDHTYSVGSGRYRETFTIESPNYFMFEIMPTVEIPLSQKVDFNLGVGYAHFIPVGDNGGGSGVGYAMFRAGFGFHKGAVPKPKKPVFDRGFQWGIEGGTFNVPDFNTAFVLSYKWNKNLSFGLGFGLDRDQSEEDEVISGTLLYRGVYGSESDAWVSADNNLFMYKLFARGTWRILDTRLSPIVSCDLGVRWMANSDENGKYDATNGGYYNIGGAPSYYGDEVTELADYRYLGVFFTPSVGLSLRTANNLYLEAKVGYTLASPVKGREETVSGVYDGYEYTCDIFVPKRKLSSPFFSIGLTHTFRLGSGWGK